MNQFAGFIKKEFFHIFRDVRTMMMLLAMPVAQLIIFGFAITTEINNTPFVVLDNSRTAASRQLIEQLSGSPYFDLKANLQTESGIERYFQEGACRLALIIPAEFSDDLYRTGAGNLQLLADASDPNEAATISSYAQQIIMRYQQNLFTQKLNSSAIPYIINTEVKMLYNPHLKSAYNFVPGIMGLILMLICAMMTSIAIVKEKEQGTMEILLVSPIKPVYIVLAKAVPYLLIAIIDVVLILLLSNTVLSVPIVGNPLLVLFLSILFTLSALSLGLLISSITDTQQAAMLISGAGLMLPTLLLSGLVFPIENMPLLLRIFSEIIPAKWFILALKDVMIKGLGISSILVPLAVLSGMTVFLLVASIKRFKNRL